MLPGQGIKAYNRSNIVACSIKTLKNGSHQNIKKNRKNAIRIHPYQYKIIMQHSQIRFTQGIQVWCNI